MQATCQECRAAFEAQRATAKYCTRACSQRATRKRAAAGLTGTVSPAPSEPTPADTEGMSLLVAATLDELTKAGRLTTALGQAALVLAEKAGNGHDTGSATAAVIRQLRETLAAATAGVETGGDPLDELRARRDRKRSG